MNFIKKLLVDRWGKRQDNFEWRIYTLPIDLASVENVGILHINGKIGDGLYTSLLVDALARARPDLKIIVGTTPAFLEYWQRHPKVHEAVAFPVSLRTRRTTLTRVRQAVQAARPNRGRFDVLVSFESYPRPDHFALLRHLAPKTLIGFNKNGFRLFDYSLDEGRHSINGLQIARRVLSVMSVFGVEAIPDVRRLHVPFNSEEEIQARAIIDRLSTQGPRMLINAYGARAERTMAPATVVSIVRAMREAGHAGPIYVSVPEGASSPYETELHEANLGADLTLIGPTPSFFALFALVSMMDIVISPDTSVNHIAAAFDKSQICLFARWGNIPLVWRPLSDRCVSVLSRSGKSVNDMDWNAFADVAQRVMADVRRVAPTD